MAEERPRGHAGLKTTPLRSSYLHGILFHMTAIARELDEKLRTLDPKAATSLERLVRDALHLIDLQSGLTPSSPTGSLDPGFFKSIAKEFGSEPFDRPPQGDSEQREGW